MALFCRNVQILLCFPFRELLLNNNQLRVLPFELGKLFQLQTLGLKGQSSSRFNMNFANKLFGIQKRLLLPHNINVDILILRSGNPLAQDIMNLYQEPDGTRRLLNYLLDNLAGTKRGISICISLNS